MYQMAGDIGKLVLNGEQVGGFRGWTAIVHLEPFIYSTVMLSGFWMFKKINTDKVIAFFYGNEGESLKLVLRKEARIHLPDDYALDKLIISPVEITFDESFDWREDG